MASSAEAAKLDLNSCLSVVQEVSRLTSKQSQPPSSLLSQLLRLLPCLESPHLSQRDLSVLRQRIWQCDLVHLVVEVLRYDYSSEGGDGWRRLANLAVTLSSVVTGLSPRPPRPREGGGSSSQFEKERVDEYYDVLLPTATDSLLILANSMLEAVEAATSPSPSPTARLSPAHNLLECFGKVLDSLVWLCSSHSQHTSITSRALQSPYLLGMLITDHALYAHVVLEALEGLIAAAATTNAAATTAQDSIASAIPQGVLSSILDELVYKLSGSEEKSALLSLRLLAQLSAALPGLIDTLTNSYAGLQTLMEKWLSRTTPNEARREELAPAVRNLVSELEARSEEGSGRGERGKEEEMDAAKQKAIVMIQASWRGFSERRKMMKARRGIRRFQQMYRRRKAEKERGRENKEKVMAETTLRQSQRESGRRAFHERQLTLYQQLPASQLPDFISKQESRAAITIQAAWRGHQARASSTQLKAEVECMKSAVVIQRAFRRHSKARAAAEREARAALLPTLDKAERERLQAEVARYREAHSPDAGRTHQQLSELHLEAQAEYEKCFFSRSARAGREQEEEIRQMIVQLNRNAELLLAAPSLADAYERPNAGLTDAFSSSSPVVARMGRTAHREEMKAMSLPWWKRTPLDHTELSL